MNEMNEWMDECVIYIYVYIQYKQTYLKITPPQNKASATQKIRVLATGKNPTLQTNEHNSSSALTWALDFYIEIKYSMDQDKAKHQKRRQEDAKVNSQANVNFYSYRVVVSQ